MRNRTTIAILLFVYVAGPVAAGSLHYQTPLDASKWETTASTLLCTLSHTVSRFGRAEFYQEAGHQPRFRFFVDQPPIRQGTVTVSSRPPGWKHDEREYRIGQYTYRVDETPFRFQREISLRLLAELEQGMAPVFSFKDWGDGRDDVTAMLSVVRFLEGQTVFRRCVGQLIPYAWDKVRNSRIHFATAQSDLTGKARQRLDAIVAYLLRDPTVKMAYVEGHADELGTHAYNNELSERRALAVRDYLLEHGVPASKLVVRYFGKRKPVSSNASEKGRGLNRRVQVRLVRE